MHDYEGFAWIGKIVIPVLLMVVGPLMVSKVRYAHFVHELIKGDRPFPMFIVLLFALCLVVICPEFVLPAIFTAYLVSGLVGVAIDRVLDRIDLAHKRGSFFR